MFFSFDNLIQSFDFYYLGFVVFSLPLRVEVSSFFPIASKVDQACSFVLSLSLPRFQRRRLWLCKIISDRNLHKQNSDLQSLTEYYIPLFWFFVLESELDLIIAFSLQKERWVLSKAMLCQVHCSLWSECGTSGAPWFDSYPTPTHFVFEFGTLSLVSTVGSSTWSFTLSPLARSLTCASSSSTPLISSSLSMVSWILPTWTISSTLGCFSCSSSSVSSLCSPRKQGTSYSLGSSRLVCSFEVSSVVIIWLHVS